MTVTTADIGQETFSEIDARLRNTFSVLEKVANGVVDTHIRAMIVSGAAGCGKTYTLEKVLDKAKSDGLISYDTVRGAMSPIGLYRKLYETAEEGNVLLLDDCDSIFADIDSLNLLKAALDTSKTRRVHWNKESRVLADEGIPNSFEFNGAAIFITNIDFNAEIEQEKKMSHHYKAFMSRCLYVDMGIHTKREILVRVSQVVLGNEFLRDNELSKAEAQEMVKWLTINVGRVRVLSIRTVLQLVSLIKTDNDWRHMAETLMLKKRVA